MEAQLMVLHIQLLILPSRKRSKACLHQLALIQTTIERTSSFAQTILRRGHWQDFRLPSSLTVDFFVKSYQLIDMKKMTRNEFLKMAGTSAALVVFNTVLMPAAVAVEPGVVALSSKKSSIEIDKGTTVNSATFKLVPISRETFWGDAGSCTLDYLSEGYIQWTITVPGAVIVSFEGNLHFNKLGTPFGTFDHAISAYGTIGTEDVKYGLSKGKWEVEFTGIATAANGDPLRSAYLFGCLAIPLR